MSDLTSGPVHELETILDAVWVTNTQNLDNPETQGKIKYYQSEKRSNNKRFLMIFFCTQKSMLYSAIIRNSSSASGGNKYIDDSQTQYTERNLEIIKSKQDVSIKLLLSGLRQPHISGVRRNLGARGHRGHHENKVLLTQLKRSHMNSQRLKHQTQDDTSLYHVLCIYIMASNGIFECVNQWVSDSCAFSQAFLIFLLAWLVQL